MQVQFKISLLKFCYILVFLGISCACSQTKFYSSKRASRWSFGFHSYVEIQFHKDGIYEEFVYTKNPRYDEAETWNYNGKFKKVGDTLFIYAYRLNFNDSGFLMKRIDSLDLVDRYSVHGRKIVHAPLDDLSPNTEYKSGKSRKLRRIEKTDSLTWENFGYLRIPFGGACYYHGLRGHSESSDLCL